jgi:hypothetical protein
MKNLIFKAAYNNRFYGNEPPREPLWAKIIILIVWGLIAWAVIKNLI